MNNRAVIPMILILLGLLVGCFGTEKRADLLAYIEEIKKRPGGEIEPLPVLKPYETFAYQAQELRSPFAQPVPDQIKPAAVADNGIRPDANRRKELLENFPIDSLKMVGTMEREGRMWALVVDKDGSLHRITQGNYVGLNDGKIQKITEEKIFIREIIPSPTGGWQERNAEMALTVQEQ